MLVFIDHQLPIMRYYLELYVEQHYGLSGEKKLLNALAVAASENHFHLIRDLLNTQLIMNVYTKLSKEKEQSDATKLNAFFNKQVTTSENLQEQGTLAVS